MVEVRGDEEEAVVDTGAEEVVVGGDISGIPPVATCRIRAKVERRRLVL